MAKASKAAFYAVHKGRVPGVYRTWDECVANVTKFADAKYKKFSTAEDALHYVEHGRERGAEQPQSLAQTAPAIGLDTTSALDEYGYDVVYTDGACKGNGQAGSIAGIGVWWGHNDKRNIAERCPGAQTNNRAELIAIIRVLETAPISKKPLMIKTDSSYSIKCIGEWIRGWQGRGWRTASGGDVANKELIQYLSCLLDQRGVQGQKVIMKHVRGHVGIVGNEGADWLANQGAFKPAVDDPDWTLLIKKINDGGPIRDRPQSQDNAVQVQIDDDAAAAEDAVEGYGTAVYDTAGYEWLSSEDAQKEVDEA